VANEIPRDTQGNVDLATLQAQQLEKQHIADLETAAMFGVAALLGAGIGTLIGGKKHRWAGAGVGAAVGSATFAVGRYFIVGFQK
jgi:hypothetical protein